MSQPKRRIFPITNPDTETPPAVVPAPVNTPQPSPSFDQPISNTIRGQISHHQHNGPQQIQTSQIQPCPEELLRLSVNCFPQTPQLEKESGLPFGVTVQPLAPTTAVIPLIDTNQIGVPRCRHCRAYINPYVSFVEGGRRWTCPFCRKLNDVLQVYYSPADAVTGKRQDHHTRPELTHSSVEFMATAEYIIRPPQPPVYVFVIDVSLYGSSSGMLHVVADAISKTIDYLIAVNELTKVAFVTCDSGVHFYAMRAGSKPLMMVHHALDAPVPPQGYDFLVNLQTFKTCVEDLLASLPSMFAVAKATQCCLGSAIQGAFNLQKIIGGKMLVFTTVVSTIGLGKNPVGDYDQKLVGTPKEISLITPKNDFFKELAMECSKQQISVDLFCCCGANFNDLASLSILPHLTGGQILNYPQFSIESTGEKFGADIMRALTTKYGWESVMRVRTSKGIKAHLHFGNLLIRSVDLCVFPVIDSEKAVTIQFKLEEAIDTAQFGNSAYIQAGLLYTNEVSERRIRVITIAVPISSSLETLYNQIDLSGLIALSAKMAIHNALKMAFREARESCVNLLIDILSGYKKITVQTGELKIPPNTEAFPMYLLGLMKNITLRSHYPVHPDDRVAKIDMLRTMPVESVLLFLYPRLFRLHDLQEEHGIEDAQGQLLLPPLVNLSASLLAGGIFLLDNGQCLMLWLSATADPNLLLQLVGTKHVEHVTPDHRLEFDDSVPASTFYNRVASIIKFIRSSRSACQRLHIIREGDANHHNLFIPYMIDDKAIQNVFSYFEFIAQIQGAVSTRK